MKVWNFVLWLGLVGIVVVAQSTAGIVDLVKRRLPAHIDAFTFNLQGNSADLISSSNPARNDEYTISSTPDGKILVEGTSLIALASG